MKKKLTILAACLLISHLLFSQEFTKNSNGAFKGVVKDFCSNASNNCGLMKKFGVSFALWTLMGEPVYDFKFNWELNESAVVGYLEGQSVYVFDLNKYPDLANRIRKVKPSKLEIGFYPNFYDNNNQIMHSKNTVVLEIEIDLPDKPGVTSFSVPSSPSWQELFKQNAYTNAELSKRLVTKAKSLNFDDIYFNKLEWSENELKSIVKEYLCREKRLEECKEYEVIIEIDTTEKDINKEDIWEEVDKAFVENKKNEDKDIWDDIEASYRDLKEKEGQEKIAKDHKIIITSPENYSTLKNNVVTISGEIVKENIIDKYFNNTLNIEYLNGISQRVKVVNGKFSGKVILKNGSNSIKLRSISGLGRNITSGLNLNLESVPVDLRVTLTWDNSADIDLHLYDPFGNRCYYENKYAGDMRLDVDNTNAYGPENITVKDVSKGTYTVRIQNFSRGIGTKATVHIFINEDLKYVENYSFKRDKEEVLIKNLRL